MKAIQEVIESTGVSRSTVYRVMRNDPIVKQQTAELVKSALVRAGYKERIGNRLRRRAGRHALGLRTQTVGLILSGLGDLAMQRPVISYMVHGIENALRHNDVNMVLSYARYPKAFPPILRDRKVDGIVLIHFHHDIDPDMARHLKPFPLVWMQPAPVDFGDEVMPNHRLSGQLAAKYLLDRGHEHLAYLNQMGESRGLLERGAAFKQAVLAAGKSASIVAATGFGPEHYPQLNGVELDWRQSVERLLELSPRPTGVFVSDDLYTTIVYRILGERGVQPGTDMEIISCNNEKSLIEALSPRPATVDLFHQQVGRRAVEQLFWRLQHPDEPRSQVLIEPKLVLPAHPHQAS